MLIKLCFSFKEAACEGTTNPSFTPHHIHMGCGGGAIQPNCHQRIGTCTNSQYRIHFMFPMTNSASMKNTTSKDLLQHAKIFLLGNYLYMVCPSNKKLSVVQFVTFTNSIILWCTSKQTYSITYVHDKLYDKHYNLGLNSRCQ